MSCQSMSINRSWRKIKHNYFFYHGFQVSHLTLTGKSQGADEAMLACLHQSLVIAWLLVFCLVYTQLLLTGSWIYFFLKRMVTRVCLFHWYRRGRQTACFRPILFFLIERQNSCYYFQKNGQRKPKSITRSTKKDFFVPAAIPLWFVQKETEGLFRTFWILLHFRSFQISKIIRRVILLTALRGLNLILKF